MNIKKLLIPVQTAGLLALSTGVAFAQQTCIGSFCIGSPAGGTSGQIGIPKRGPVQIDNIGVLIGSILGILLIISAIAAFIFLILGGLQWITSGGDKAQLEAARGKITNAIIGLIVVAASFAIMILVQNFLGLGNLFGGAIDLPRAY